MLIDRLLLQYIDCNNNISVNLIKAIPLSTTVGLSLCWHPSIVEYSQPRASTSKAEKSTIVQILYTILPKPALPNSIVNPMFYSQNIRNSMMQNHAYMSVPFIPMPLNPPILTQPESVISNQQYQLNEISELRKTKKQRAEREKGKYKKVKKNKESSTVIENQSSLNILPAVDDSEIYYNDESLYNIMLSLDSISSIPKGFNIHGTPKKSAASISCFQDQKTITFPDCSLFGLLDNSIHFGDTNVHKAVEIIKSKSTGIECQTNTNYLIVAEELHQDKLVVSQNQDISVNKTLSNNILVVTPEVFELASPSVLLPKTTIEEKNQISIENEKNEVTVISPRLFDGISKLKEKQEKNDDVIIVCSPSVPLSNSSADKILMSPTKLIHLHKVKPISHQSPKKRVFQTASNIAPAILSRSNRNLHLRRITPTYLGPLHVKEKFILNYLAFK